MQIRTIAILAAATMSLSACLDNDLERGAAGAAAGAVVADVTGGNVLTGAVVGGAAGVLCDDAGVCE